MKYYIIIIFLLFPLMVQSQGLYNHPEIEWETIETDHFKIHFYSDTEILAREAAGVLEYVYPHITDLYQYEPKEKTHLVFTDTEDVSNGVAYYYDNKMIIWASPLDIALRGSHKWLENVLTHEFTHIISIQKAMKAGTAIPGAYFQWIGYENETHQNVLYGYPNAVVSYPVPGAIVPPWLAEGTAQYMYKGANWDNWDSHRDMILRDRALYDNLQSFAEINTFGKCGIGNESVYNTGYAFVNYIADRFGSNALRELMEGLSNPFQFSIDKVIQKVTGISGKDLYEEYSTEITQNYNEEIESIGATDDGMNIIEENGTTNLYPKWSNDGDKIAYISNKNNDYFGQTDLFIYDLENDEEEKIAANIHSAPSWGAGDSIIYYSKKPKMRNSKGYRYYDLFEYNINTKEENRLTKFARAISPLYIENLNSIAYIAMDNGKQSIYLFSIENEISEKIVEFDDRRILHNLYLDNINNRIIFDYTSHHFRNIAELSLVDFRYDDIIANSNVDERDVCITNNGEILHSNNANGIFNLIQKDSSDYQYITNVPGGAFMPDVNASGQIIFSLYKNGGYKLAMIDSIQSIDTIEYEIVEKIYQKPIKNYNESIAQNYQDNFAQMFVIPRIMIDYGTVKPGLYFYSSEVLEKLSLNGGVTVNFDKDIDFGFNLAFRKLYPTIYTDFMYATRNTIDKSNYSVYEIDDRLKFRFVLMQLGIQFPIFGSQPLEIYTSWQRYRAYIKENIEFVNLESGYSYDYYRGLSTGIKYSFNNVKMRVDREINPSKGFRMAANIAYESNDFIDGLNLSDSGTLIEEFKSNNFTSVNINGSYYATLLPAKRWTLGVTAKGGWLSNQDVDSFFNYFGGGMDGIQGYPYYSFEGTNSLFTEIAMRIPVFRLQHIPIGWTIWQNATIGLEYQLGDAWSNEFNLKQSLGLQFRINGFSFYNYPTAIGFEIHRGLTEFEIETDDEIVKYGNKNRYYLSILFGF